MGVRTQRAPRLFVCGNVGTWEATQPCISPGLNRVPALIGWDKGGDITAAGWQVTLRDPIWHANSRSGEACLRTVSASVSSKNVMALYKCCIVIIIF